VDEPHLVDERKLFYVAATRARDLLILSTADVSIFIQRAPGLFISKSSTEVGFGLSAPPKN
jgi:superfamily I DNA/RNA helicase